MKKLGSLFLHMEGTWVDSAVAISVSYHQWNGLLAVIRVCIGSDFHMYLGVNLLCNYIRLSIIWIWLWRWCTDEKGVIFFFVDRHAQGYGTTHCSCSLNRIDKTARPRRRLKRKPSGWLKRQRKKLPSISLRSLSSHYTKSPLTHSVYWILLYHVNCASGSHNVISYCSFMNWLTTALNLLWEEGSPTICLQRLPKEVRALSSVGNNSFLDDFHLITLKCYIHIVYWLSSCSLYL